MSRYVGTTEESISDRMERHEKHPGYRTDITPEHPDTVIRRINRFKLGVYAPTDVHQWGGLLGILDVTQQADELSESRSPLLPRQSSKRVYHETPELIVGDLPDAVQHSTIPGDECPLPTWGDYFTGGAWTGLSADRFPRSNWGKYTNPYTIQPDYRVATGESRAPESVHESQVGLDEYSDVSACGYSEVRECSCCVCPECGSVAIRERKNRIESERYACGNPACETGPFPEPDVRPTRR